MDSTSKGTSSVEDMYRVMQIKNQKQQELIDLLKNQLAERDKEIQKMRSLIGEVSNVPAPNSRVMSSPIKRATPVNSKDYIVENKLQVLKKSMAKQAASKPNSEF
jgi:hypothetical protein